MVVYNGDNGGNTRGKGGNNVESRENQDVTVYNSVDINSLNAPSTIERAGGTQFIIHPQSNGKDPNGPPSSSSIHPRVLPKGSLGSELHPGEEVTPGTPEVDPSSEVNPSQEVYSKKVFFAVDITELDYPTFEGDDLNYQILDEIVEDLRANPASSIEITGSASPTHNDEHNMGLATDRAKAVYDYVVERLGADYPNIDDKVSYNILGESVSKARYGDGVEVDSERYAEINFNPNGLDPEVAQRVADQLEEDRFLGITYGEANPRRAVIVLDPSDRNDLSLDINTGGGALAREMEAQGIETGYTTVSVPIDLRNFDPATNGTFEYYVSQVSEDGRSMRSVQFGVIPPKKAGTDEVANVDFVARYTEFGNRVDVVVDGQLYGTIAYSKADLGMELFHATHDTAELRDKSFKEDLEYVDAHPELTLSDWRATGNYNFLIGATRREDRKLEPLRANVSIIDENGVFVEQNVKTPGSVDISLRIATGSDITEGFKGVTAHSVQGSEEAELNAEDVIAQARENMQRANAEMREQQRTAERDGQEAGDYNALSSKTTSQTGRY